MEDNEEIYNEDFENLSDHNIKFFSLSLYLIFLMIFIIDQPWEMNLKA